MEPASPSSRQAVCSVIACNYLAYARTLAESLRQSNPGLPLYVLVIDPWADRFDPAQEAFTVIPVEALAIPDLAAMRFKYNITEFATAVKPFFFEHLFDRYGVEKLLYLDPDILATGSLAGLYARLDEADYVLTPHLDRDFPDNLYEPQVGAFMMTGAFNLGFLGLRRSPGGLALTRWLQGKFVDHCVVNYGAGYFVDQKFFDIAITLFPGFHIERDTGYNAAPWNVHSRTLSRPDGQWLCNGTPLYFYHFSNYKPALPDRLAGYILRYTLSNRPDLAPLYGYFRERLQAHGHATSSRWPYAFNQFDDGTPISEGTRQYYQDTWRRRPEKDPFASPHLKRLNRGYALLGKARGLARPVKHWLRDRIRRGLRRGAAS